MIKTVFFGTAEFAEQILSHLLQNPDFQVDLVITQPDKPVGRKQILESPPVKITAEKYNIKVMQPKSLKKDFDLNILKNFDLGVTCQYGLIIPKSVIEAPKHQIINIHPSLLPKYRGASPLQSALLDGVKETGVSIMLIDEKMDHGPILAQEKIEISPDDTTTDLRNKTLPIAQKLMVTTAIQWVRGGTTPQIQNESEATFCSMFEKEDGQVDFTKNTAAEIYNKYRGFIEWPGIWTILQNIRIKLLNIKPVEENLAPGVVKKIDKKMFVGTTDGTLQILELQPEGKKPMTGEAFLNGYYAKFLK